MSNPWANILLRNLYQKLSKIKLLNKTLSKGNFSKRRKQKIYFTAKVALGDIVGIVNFNKILL